jgi:Tfp pilus assembly protein PilX
MENLYKVTRAKLNKKLTHEKGMVLIVVILFLSVVSLLALNLLNTSLLETKMSNYYQNKARTFYQAENYLIQSEQAILRGEQIANAEIIDAGICGVTFYRVFAEAKYNAVHSKLQSTLAKINDLSICNPKPMVKQGRQSFLVVD